MAVGNEAVVLFARLVPRIYVHYGRVEVVLSDDGFRMVRHVRSPLYVAVVMSRSEMAGTEWSCWGA